MAKSALLVMDVQQAIVDRNPDSGYLPRLRRAIDAAPAAGVPADSCLDADPEVHRVLTEKVFPRQADVVTIDEWVSGS
jgi:nicotinamidase-related amidase